MSYAFVQKPARFRWHDWEWGETTLAKGRIIRRRHSHDRSWYSRHEDRTPRSLSVASSVGIPDGDDLYWASDRFYAVREMNVVPARKEDWAQLRRLNAGRPEFTLESVMPSQLIEMRSKG